MLSTTAKAGKSKKQQLSSATHCNNLSRTLTNDNNPSLSLLGLSSKPTDVLSAVSSSLSTAVAATTTAVVAAAADDTDDTDDTTNNHCNALKHCNGGVTSTNNSNGSSPSGSPDRNTTLSGRENDEKKSLQCSPGKGSPATSSLKVHPSISTQQESMSTIHQELTFNIAIPGFEDLDSYEKEYKGSPAEKADVLENYTRFQGDMSKMLMYVLFSSEDDVSRWWNEFIGHAIEVGNVLDYNNDELELKYDKDDEEDEEDNITDAKRRLMDHGYTPVYHSAPSDRERVEFTTKKRPKKNRGRIYESIEKWYPCPSQSAEECLSHADLINPKRWIGTKPSAVNGGVPNCNKCAGLKLNLMSNGTSFVCTPDLNDSNTYCRIVFGKSGASKKISCWRMHNQVPVPPMELKQQDEGLLEAYRRDLQRKLQPDVVLAKNAKKRARHADMRAQGATYREARGEQHFELDVGDNVETIEFPDQYTDQLTIENLMSWIKDILKRFPHARIFVYVGKGSLKITRNGQGVISSAAVPDDETTKNLTATRRNAFAINAEGNNFKKEDFEIVHDIKVEEIVDFDMLQDKIVSVSKFEAVSTQSLAFAKELETMAAMKQVQRSLQGGHQGKLTLCNEIEDYKAGSTSKVNKANGGSVFVNAYVVPEEDIGVKWLLNSDRSPEFQSTLTNQLKGLDFAAISRPRSEKQKGKTKNADAVTNARHEKRKKDENEGIDAIINASKSKKQK